MPFLKRLNREIAEDNLLTWASALAYSWLFAIFPFFIFLLTLIPYLPQNFKGEAKRDVIRWINYLPRETAQNVRDVVEPRLNQLLDMAGGVGGFYLASSLGFAKQFTGSYHPGFLIFGMLAVGALLVISPSASSVLVVWPSLIVAAYSFSVSVR